MTDLMLLPPHVLATAKKVSNKRGHIMPPGTGPAGETCKTCAYLHRNEMSKTYLKCWLNRARWTGGAATDIRASDPACSKWAAVREVAA